MHPINDADRFHRERSARLRHEFLVARMRRARRSKRWAERSARLASVLARRAQTQRVRAC
ncbi:hypothetical protein [Jiangella gansuensis]|uniref:hypothetical protein n=1 Tax=Jiangella gansuensis TaxID=281473 RepID=UPI00047B4C97|nr:hypothetical protein [Jiangella gansuensis]